MRKLGKRYLFGLGVGVLLAAVGVITLGAQLTGGVTGTSDPLGDGSGAGNPANGKRIAGTKCVACHGADGNSAAPQYPKLAGQNPAYLYAQLRDFNSGARKSEIMSGIAGTISRTDAADVASYYSQQPSRPDPVNDQAAVDIGKRIFFTGNGSRRVPPCAMCHAAGGQRAGMGMMGHGMMGSGPSSNVPRLNGQHATYVIDQLNRFADGRRTGTVMGSIAKSLSDTDRKAVAEYLSTLHASRR